MIHVVKNQTKSILPNDWTCDISLVPITWPNLPCLTEHAWSVRLLFTLIRDEKTTLLVTLLLIPNELEKVLGIQRLETLEELEIQYSQALTWSQSEKHFNKALQLASHICLPLLPFLYHCSPLYRNINSTTILLHRTTVHMWRWFYGFAFLILMKTN